MATGNPIIPVRFPRDLLLELDQIVSLSHTTRRDEPWTRSAFILAAVREKLAKMQRSREWRTRKNRKRITSTPAEM